MNELDLIRAVRDEVPDPDADTTARARVALLEAFARPERPTAPTPCRQRVRKLPLAIAVIAATAATVLVALSLLPGGDSGAPGGAAAAVLRREARLAASQPTLAPPRPGQYVYTESQSVQESDWNGVGPNHDQSFSVLIPHLREVWIAPDSSGRLRETEGAPKFLTDHDRAAWIAAGRPELGGNNTSDESFRAGGLSYLDLSKLPTEPEQLRTMIEQRQIEGGPPGDGETFAIVGDLLRETYAPPQVRAALFQIVSNLPGVQLIGASQDGVGRSGIAVAYTNADIRHELIFDPSTSALLGEQTVIADPTRNPSLPAGTVVSWAAYLTSAIVDSTSATL